MTEPLFTLALSGFTSACVLALATWIASVRQHDVSLVDRVWSLLIASAAFTYAWMLMAPGPRTPLMLGILSAWAIRLAAYVTWRNWGHGEDRRYQAIRARNQPNFAFKSFYLIFVLQAVLAWFVSAPFLTGMASTAPLNVLDWAGLALAAFGVVFEAVGDQQMANFKADSANKGRVMDRGLWRYTRHPNYFGECCVWWGLYASAVAAGGGWWTIVSPIVMTVLLLKVSGVSLLEKDIAERRPAYRDYVESTNAFFPGPRRSSSSST